MSENQIRARIFDCSMDVTDLLQTFISRGYNLTEYFISITMNCSPQGCWAYVVFYDKRYEEDKPTIT